MKKIIKLLILIILSLSVYFIYQQTKNKTITIMAIGDGLSLGINSYGIEEYSYLNYYKDYLEEENIILSNNYSKKDLTIKETIETINNKASIKRDLREADKLFLNIGYNDLIFYLNLEDNITQPKYNKIIRNIEKDFENLIKEITKYYKNEIIVIGYYKSNKDDIYIEKGILDLNNYLKNNHKITYIDTYHILENRNKFFSNPNSNYPNNYGYQRIATKIIEKTLEKS
jgi:lysophospholipase L1-like esterase